MPEPTPRAPRHPDAGGSPLREDDLTQPLTRQAARRQATREAAPPVRGPATGRRPAAPHPGPQAKTRASHPRAPAAPGRPAPGRETATRSRASGALARASALMAAGTAVSRVLGFVRAGALASVIGATTAGADTFALANTIPNTLYLLIAGGVLNAVLVPQVVKAMKREDGGAEYLDRLVTAAVIALAAVTGVLVIAAPAIVSVFAHSSAPGQHALAVAFALWCLPQVFFYALYTLLGQVLNAKGRFGAYMWAPVINNVVAVIGVGVFAVLFGVDHARKAHEWTMPMVAVLGGTSTLGVIAQALVLIGPLRQAGVRLRPRFGLRGVGLGSAGRSTIWVVAGVVIGMGANLVVSNVSFYASHHAAAGVATPGYAVWGYAYLLFMLPHSLVAVSLVTALFTRMSTSATSGDARAVRSDVSYGLRTIGVTSMLAAAGLIVLARPAAVVLTDAGPATGRAIALVILAMAVGLLPFSANYLMQRAFYAFEDARTPFLTQVVAVIVWSLGSLIAAALLKPQHIVAGAALSMSAGQLCAAAIAFVRLREKLGGLDVFRVFRTHARLAVAAVLAAVAGWVVSHPLGFLVDGGRLGALVVAALAGAVMVAVYGGALVVMRVEEVRPLARRVAAPLARRMASRTR